jgi:diacylglycerol O-acyltransferase
MRSRQPSAQLHNQQRLSPADAQLLDLEDRRRLPVHTGSVAVFEGPAPTLEELTEHVRARLGLVPRYGMRVVGVPLRQGRPLWIPDGELALAHHVRAVALPGGKDDSDLSALAASVLEGLLDRDSPLWELHLVESLAGERFALIAKSHAALVDGAGNRALLSVLLDGERPPARADTAPWPPPGPPPAPPRLLLDALAERARSPREALESARALASRAREELQWHDLDPLERFAAPAAITLLNAEPGPHRRFSRVEVGLKPVRAAKERLGGTVHDVILTAVAGALGGYLRAHGEDTNGLVLRALVPLADARSGRLLAAHAPLPLGIEDPRRRHAEISRALDGLRASGRALAVAEMIEGDGFAPATTVAGAARLVAQQRTFNVAIANVPGPQSPRALLGRELRAFYPALPLARRQALSIAVASCAGRLCFGLLSDYDAVRDLDVLAGMLKESLRELPRGGGKQRAKRR